MNDRPTPYADDTIVTVRSDIRPDDHDGYHNPSSAARAGQRGKARFHRMHPQHGVTYAVKFDDGSTRYYLHRDITPVVTAPYRVLGPGGLTLTRHHDLTSAEEEARKAAESNPGDEFQVLQHVAIFKAPKPVASVTRL